MFKTKREPCLLWSLEFEGWCDVEQDTCDSVME